MLAKAAFLALSLQFSWFVPTASANSPAESLNAKLDRRVTNYNLGVCNFVEALIHVSSEFQIPTGIEWMNTPSTRATLTFAWKDATVKEVIETIAKTQPGYKAEVRNGVVHIFSPTLVPQPQNFLDLKIKEFQVRNGFTDLALLKLRNLISPAKYSGFSMGENAGEPKVSLEMKESTVRDILDALALASTRKIWIVAFSSDPSPTAAGFHKTVALWDGLSPISEQGEPALNLLHWGDKIPWPSSAPQGN